MDTPKYWFPAKRYGWGWGLPVTRQGWLVFIVYLVALVIGSRVFRPDAHPVGFAVFVILASLLLVLICYKKGEPPKWRWGNKGR
ncbi:hypothetical protein OL229_00080 [Neisseriaceae bacterium JH1-16]|nr:hypothetical protein [Neisseriaceae bacterium JH1-16]